MFGEERGVRWEELSVEEEEWACYWSGISAAPFGTLVDQGVKGQIHNDRAADPAYNNVEFLQSGIMIKDLSIHLLI